MHEIPKTAADALAIYRDRNAEDWERDYAATMIAGLDEGRALLFATACNPQEDEMLQQRAATCLAHAWADSGELMSADISGFTPVAREEMEFQRGGPAPGR